MSATPVITKQSTAVLHLDDSKNEFARWFVMRVDGEVARTLTLSTEDWIHLGSPEQITVTIEPDAALTDQQVEETASSGEPE